MKKLALSLLLLFTLASMAGATVSSTTSKVQYSCNGVATVYAYTFRVISSDEVKAIVTTSGVDTDLTYSTEYTVSGAGATGGGNVTLSAASKCPSGSTLTLARHMNLTQTTDYVEGDKFPAESHERALDKLTLIAQEQNEKLSRAILLPDGTGLSWLEIPVNAGQAIGWDGDGLSLITYPTGTITDAMMLSTGQTVTAQHTFGPATARAPFVLGANAQNQLVTGLAAQTAVTATSATSATSATTATTATSASGVKVSADDTTPAGLEAKIVAGTGITVTVLNPGANETVSISQAVATANQSIGSYRNLLIVNNSGAPNSKIDITADFVSLPDTSYATKATASFAATVDMAASGANGLDTGTEASSTWYHIWLISDGTNWKGLLSTSATSPTMPGIYTYKLRVGAIYNNGSSNFITLKQINERAYSSSLLIGSEATTATSLNIGGVSGAIPTTATGIMAHLGSSSSNTATIGISLDSAQTYILGILAAVSQTWNGSNTGVTQDIWLPGSQTIYYRCADGGGTTTLNRIGWMYSR